MHAPTNPAWHPRIREVITTLRDAQAAMDHWLQDLPVEHHTMRLAADRWSVTDIVEHLAMVEDGTGRRIGALIKEAAGTTEAATSPMAPTMEHFRVWQPVRPVPAPPMVTPTGSLSYAQALHAQQTARARLIAAFDAASGRDLAAVSVPHPALGVLNAYQWGLFVAQHQHRHLHQMRTLVSSIPS
ncbi:MAG: hypothetical protein RLZZ621_1984 [Gemmatimonadota bacterium]